MKITKIAFVLVCLIAFISCKSPATRPEPMPPSLVRNWERYNERGATIIGDFLLKRGGSTNNGKLRVELIDLIAGDLSTSPNEDAYRVKCVLRFVQSSDGKLLCEDQFVEKSSTPISITKCKNQLTDHGVLSIYIDAINLKDNWAHIQLLE